MNRSHEALVVLLAAAAAPAQFQVLQQIPAPGRPSVVEVMDVNGDGLPDVAALNATHSQVNVWQGLAGGGFAAPIAVTMLPNRATHLAVGDLDGDRRQDLLVLGDAGGSWGITVSLAAPGGVFDPPRTQLVSQPGCCPRLGDLDGDGDPDLVYRANGALLVVHLGDGAGGFGAETFYPVWPVPADLALADLDGDGNLDVAAAVGNANVVHVLWGDGTGAFPSSSFVAVSGRDVNAVAAGDADGDGLLDLCVVATNSSEVAVLENHGGRSFSETGRFFTRPSPSDLMFGDLDGDGNGDLAVMHGFSPVQFAFLRGDGAGNFPMRQWFVVSGSEEGQGTIADLDLDGRSEVVVPVDGGDQILVIGDPVSTPSGLSSYGNGTPGCRGGLGLTGNGAPAVGNASFAFLASNAPPEAFGLVALGMAQDLNGSDPFGVGALLHIGISGPVLTDPFPADAGGAAFAPAALPANPGLAGLQFYAQGVWLELRTGSVCTASPLGLVTSRGLGITIQP